MLDTDTFQKTVDCLKELWPQLRFDEYTNPNWVRMEFDKLLSDYYEWNRNERQAAHLDPISLGRVYFFVFDKYGIPRPETINPKFLSFPQEEYDEYRCEYFNCRPPPPSRDEMTMPIPYRPPVTVRVADKITAVGQDVKELPCISPSEDALTEDIETARNSAASIEQEKARKEDLHRSCSLRSFDSTSTIRPLQHLKKYVPGATYANAQGHSLKEKANADAGLGFPEPIPRNLNQTSREYDLECVPRTILPGQETGYPTSRDKGRKSPSLELECNSHQMQVNDYKQVANTIELVKVGSYDEAVNHVQSEITQGRKEPKFCILTKVQVWLSKIRCRKMNYNKVENTKKKLFRCNFCFGREI